jgi:hypothetical protein
MSTQQDVAPADHGNLKQVTIVVNTREVIVDKGELTFEELVAIAFPTVPTGPNVLITISYRRGHGDKPDGSLLPGESVKVKDGMKFVVSATDKS